MNGFWHEYLHILSDPAHMLAELSFFLVLDVIILGGFYPLLKKAAARVAERSVKDVVEARVLAEHAILDAEHGIEHP